MIRIITIAALFAAPLILPQQGNLTWYKGNLHTHSLWSDGDAFPETAVSWYKEHGYHFIALSDHNILADHEKWVHIGRQDQAYLEYKNILVKVLKKGWKEIVSM
jgi:histidinol phosphatase-like PHP family hydrolase